MIARSVRAADYDCAGIGPAFAGDDTGWGRRHRRLEIEPVPQILARFQDALQECAVGFARHHRLEQIKLVGRHELQDLGADFAFAIARQGLHDLDMLRRLHVLCRCKLIAQLRFQCGPVGFHKSIQSDAAAPIGECDDGGIADAGVFPDQAGQHRSVVDQPPAAAFAVGEIEQAAGDGAIELLAGHQPDAGDQRLPRQDLALLGRQCLRRIAALVLEQMPQILIGGDPEQAAAGLETVRELKVRDVGPAIIAAQPVLLFCQIVMADTGAVQPAQRLLGGAEIGGIAMRLCQMQRHAIDESAHQGLSASPQQFRTGIEAARLCQRVALAREQMARQNVRP